MSEALVYQLNISSPSFQGIGVRQRALPVYNRARLFEKREGPAQTWRQAFDLIGVPFLCALIRAFSLISPRSGSLVFR